MYSDTITDVERNKIILKHMPLIKKNAKSMHTKLWRYLDNEELIDIGVLGVIEAFKTFNPEKNTDFSKFCLCRIRGKVLDHCRNQDWVPRRTRKLFEAYKYAQEQLESELKRKPTFTEIKAHLNLNDKQFKMLSANDSPCKTVSLNILADAENDDGLNYQLVDSHPVDPSKNLQAEDCKFYITKGLGNTERLVVELYYYQQLSMKEIAQTIGITESRISQIHSTAIDKLREKFQRDPDRLKAAV